MRVTISDRRPEAISADALVVLFYVPRRGKPGPALIEHVGQHASRLISRRAEASTWLEARELPTPRVLFHCLGSEPDVWDPQLEYLGGHAGSLRPETERIRARQRQRVAGAMIERACTSLGLRHVVLAGWPAGVDPCALVEGMRLRAHDARAWEDERASAGTLRRVSVCLPPSGQEMSRAEARAEAERLREHMQVIDATNFARTLADLPGNVGSAAEIVARVETAIADRPLRLSTISAAQAKELGMGLFTAVDAGARERGCILRLDYEGEPASAEEQPLLVLVGKGLTHDTGGYNLKRSDSIHALTYDKCGATAVIGAMLAIASLGLPLRVLALCPLTENCVDAHAYKPGDVLTACDKTTVYVENTDAEGRLVMADVLAWLREQGPRPELVIDVATLTGSIHTALGEPFAGLFCNEDRARDLLIAAGEASGELVWPMPIHEDHDRDLGHPKADLRNLGHPAGGASSAAAFLRHFVDYPWAHLDIAGKAFTEFARDTYGPGATGFGCRLLVDFARRFARWLATHDLGHDLR